MYILPPPSNYVMAELIRIGNSQGIRIPKALIEQAGLEGELELKVTSRGLLVKPKQHPRAGWQAAFEAASEAGELTLDTEWLAAELDSELD